MIEQTQIFHSSLRFWLKIWIAQSFLAAIFGLSSAFAGPVQEAERLVESAGIDPESGPRLWDLMISHPTEEVLVIAAHWPWHRAVLGTTADNFIKARVSHHTRLRDHFFRMLNSESPQEIRVAVDMLSDVIGQDPAIRERFRTLATQGNADALKALATLSADDRDIEIMLSSTQQTLSPMATVLSRLPLVTNERVRDWFLYNLGLQNNQKRRKSFVGALGTLSVMDPAILGALRNQLSEPISPENIETRIIAIGKILDRYPKDQVATKALQELTVWTLEHLGEIKNSEHRIFDLIEHHSQAVPNIHTKLFVGFERAIALFEQEKIQDWEVSSFIFRQFFGFLLQNLDQAPSNIEVRIRHFLTFMRYDDRRRAQSLIVISHHLFDNKLGQLARELISIVNSQNLLVNRIPLSNLNELETAIIERDLESTDTYTLESALKLLLRHGLLEEPRIFAKVQALAESSNADISSAVSKVLKHSKFSSLIAPLRQPLDKTVTELLERQRDLLLSDTPRAGWTKITELIRSDPFADPFLFDIEGSRQLLEHSQEGRIRRERLLSEAKIAFERAGLIIHPVAFVSDALKQRSQALQRAHSQPSRMTPAQIETEVLNRLRTLYPRISSRDLSQEPFKRLYSKIQAELAMQDGLGRSTQNSLRVDVISDAWRELTFELLQYRFRANLRLILQGQLGQLLAQEEGSDHFLDQIEITENDLDQIRVLPYPSQAPYGSHIEWRGRAYRLIFRGSSIKSLPLRDYEVSEASELAALTLGSRRAQSIDLAKEVFVIRTFDNWVSQFQKASSLLLRTQAGELGHRLGDEKTLESNLLKSVAALRGSTGFLLTLLWQPISDNPNHWRDREAEAHRDHRPSWRLITLDSQLGTKLASNDPWASRELIERFAGNSNSFSDERGHAHNKKMPDEGDELYSLMGEDLPIAYLGGFADDFKDSSNYELFDEPAEVQDAAISIRTQKYRRVSNNGIVAILQPISRELDYDLQSITVFDRSGSRLHPKRDYEIVLHKTHKTLALKILYPTSELIRYSATYQVGQKKQLPKIPLVAAEQVLTEAELLKQIGATALATALVEAVESQSQIDLSQLGEVFADSAEYPDEEILGLGLHLDRLNITNPYFDHARFLNQDGIFCAQCDGGNELFQTFASRVVPKDVQVFNLPLQIRSPLKKALAANGSHLSTFVLSPGDSALLEIDATPRNRLLVRQLGQIGQSSHDSGRRTQFFDNRYGPQRLAEINAQIRSARDELQRVVIRLQELRAVPQLQSWDRTEALSRAFLLASLAIQTTDTRSDLTALAHRLHHLRAALGVDASTAAASTVTSSTSEQNALKVRELLLAQIAGLARSDHQRLKAILSHRAIGAFAYYRNPALLDPLQLLFSRLETSSVGCASLVF